MDQAGNSTITPSEMVRARNQSSVALHLLNFNAILMKYRDLPIFKSLYMALTSMDYLTAQSFVADCRSAPFQMLPYLIGNNAEFDPDDLRKINVAGISISNLDSVLRAVAKHPQIRDFGTTMVTFEGVRHISVGKYEAEALDFLKAIIMSNDLNNLSALIAETGSRFAIPWRLINDQKFVDWVNLVIAVPTELSFFCARVASVRDALSAYMLYNEFAFLLAVFLCLPLVSPELLVKIGGDFVQHAMSNVVKLAPFYVVPEIKPFHEIYDLGDDVGPMGLPKDPWNLEKGPVYDEVNHSIRKDYVDEEATSHDDFAMKLYGLDRVSEEFRGARALEPQWDMKSKQVSELLPVEQCLPYVDLVIDAFKDSTGTVDMWLSSGNVLGGVVRDRLPIDSYGTPPPAVGRVRPQISLLKEFASQILEKKGKAIVIVDALEQVFVEELGKNFLTVQANVRSMRKQIDFFRLLLRGTSDSTRFPISDAPALLVWRLVSPYDPVLFNQFDELLVRMHSYYDITYHPPSHAHEPQFVLVFQRRSRIEQNKFIEGKGIKRTFPFILKFVDFSRRYYGTVHREMVFRHYLSPVSMRVVRDVFNNAVHGSIRSKKKDYVALTRNFQVQFRHLDPMTKLVHEQEMVRYLGVKMSKKQGKSATRERVQKASRSILDEFNRHCKTFADGPILD